MISGFNTGICIFRAWTAVGCLILFVDAIIWNQNVVDRSPIWCTIGILLHLCTLLNLIAKGSGTLFCRAECRCNGCNSYHRSQSLQCCFPQVGGHVQSYGAQRIMHLVHSICADILHSNIVHCTRILVSRLVFRRSKCWSVRTCSEFNFARSRCWYWMVY
jgi:hypothetical protein